MQNIECHVRFNLSVLDDVVVELQIHPGSCCAEGRPEPESDVDQEDEGDLESDVLLL